MKKKIVKVGKNKHKVITRYKFKGDKKYTDKKTGVNMGEQNKIKNVDVSSKNNKKYLRSKPNKTKKDNLDNLD